MMAAARGGIVRTALRGMMQSRRTVRRIHEPSFAAAVFTQLVFVATWWEATGGCFCSAGGWPSRILTPAQVGIIIRVSTFPGEPLPQIRSLPNGINLILMMTVNILFWYGVFAAVRAGARAFPKR